MAYETNILIVLVAYLTIFSVITGWFLLNVYGVSAAGIVLPQNTDIGQIHSQNQNFSSDMIDYDVINAEGVWTYTAGEGRVLTQLGRNGISYLLIDKLQPDAVDSYDNTYYIDNSATNILGEHGDYSIILRYTGGVDQNEIVFNKDGVYIPTYLLNAYTRFGSKYSYSSPNINQVTNPKIRTVYKDTAGDMSLTVYMDDEELFTTTSLNENQNLFGVWGRQYGGVSSGTLGFTLFDFQTANQIIDKGTTTGLDTLGYIVQLITVILAITTFQINPMYLPLEWSIILVGLPEAAIIIAIAKIVRGG